MPITGVPVEFKVHEDDWGKAREEDAFCPFRGHAADADHWWTNEQLRHVESVAEAEIEGFMADALHEERSAIAANS
jgi:hypothetical protein